MTQAIPTLLIIEPLSRSKMKRRISRVPTNMRINAVTFRSICSTEAIGFEMSFLNYITCGDFFWKYSLGNRQARATYRVITLAAHFFNRTICMHDIPTSFAFAKRITPLMRAHMDLHHILCLGRHEFRVHEDLNIMDH